MSSIMNQQKQASNKEKLLVVSSCTIFAPIIGVISLWAYWRLYISQITNPPLEIIGDSLYIMSIFFGASLFIFPCAAILGLYNMLLCIKRRTVFRLVNEIDPKTFRKGVLILVIIGGGFAFVSNIILLHKIIPENGYVLCPKKIGYKKNLMRDYVLDVSQCERF